MKKILLISCCLWLALGYCCAQNKDSVLSENAVIMVVNTDTQHTQVTQFKWADGREQLNLHFYDKNGAWAKCGVSRDVNVEPIELSQKQLKKLKVSTVDINEFAAANDKHAIWAKLCEYLDNGKQIYVVDMAKASKNSVEAYPILSVIFNTSDADRPF